MGSPPQVHFHNDKGCDEAVVKAGKRSVVIVGADIAALGMSRSLVMEGVPVIVVDCDPMLPGMHSRSAKPFLVRDIVGPTLIDDLLALRARLDHRPILFLTSDVQVRTISADRARLEQAFQIRLPEHECLCDLLDKGRFQQIAERHGFSVPRAVMVRDEKDFSKLDQLNFPVVIKPCSTEYLIRTQALRAQMAASRAQALVACRATLSKVPEVIVQEWVDGEDSDIYFCLQYRGEDGATIISFTGRKLRCWPPRTGSTASCTSAPEYEDHLERLTTDFFRKVGCIGMCSMEYKQDRRTGQFVMIEPTVGRTDWQEEVAMLNGVNIPFAAYCYEIASPPPAMNRPPTPRIWGYEPYYWCSVFVSRTLADTGPVPAKYKSACWRVSDPVPFAFLCLASVRAIMSRAVACVRKANHRNFFFKFVNSRRSLNKIPAGTNEGLP
jgi:D-aspartate ligase